jgi:hypothetical protein
VRASNLDAIVCIFCGQDRKRSREDVFPKWLHPLFPLLGEAEYLRRLVSPSSRDEHRRPASSVFDVIVRDICTTCNNGWMSQLEQQVKPILMPMLLDQSRTLTAPEQHTLAMWATKTALTMQGANIGGERFTPAADYHWFHDHVAPLPNAHIWLCRYGGQGNWPLSVHQWGLTMRPPGAPEPQPSDPVNGYSVVFAIGPVVFWLWGHSLTGGPLHRSALRRRPPAHLASARQRRPLARPAARSRPRPSYRNYPTEHPQASNLADLPRWLPGYPSSRTKRRVVCPSDGTQATSRRL